jgi:hypothetical protein
MSTDLTTRGQRIPDANCFGVSGSWSLVGAADVLLIWRACLLRDRFEGPVDHAGAGCCTSLFTLPAWITKAAR